MEERVSENRIRDTLWVPQCSKDEASEAEGLGLHPADYLTSLSCSFCL